MTRLVVLALVALGTAPAPAADWPGFRGTGDSLSAAKNLPVEWSAATNVGWTLDLPGYGQSSPVVWKGTVYVTCVSGDMRDTGYVVAADAATGKEAWRHTFVPTQKAKMTFSVSRAAPTPCADADGVYCFFEGGNLFALTHAGKVRWERSLVADYGEFKGGHGVGSSPCQTADTLFVLVDHGGPCYLVAVDKATGQTRWKADRQGKMSWSSPVVASAGGQPAVIASSNGSVTAYAADTGAEVWKLDGVAGNTIPSATVAGEAVVIGAGAGRDGKAPAGGAKSNCCLSLTTAGSKPGYEVRWSAKAGLANYASPLVLENHAYFVNSTGVLSCYDLTTGKECYAERIDGPCWATPVGANGMVYCFGKNGVTTVVKAGPAFEKVAANRLWPADAKPKADAAPKPPADGGPGRSAGEYGDPILYGVAATDGAFLVRTGTTLYRVGK
jgi:outer membrane protein assembly factor BamB